MAAPMDLLTSAEMGAADRLAAAMGIASVALMEAAGAAVADAAREVVRGGARIAIACGPGNNGGDGLAAAALLRAAGFDVEVGADAQHWRGDAAVMAARWGGPIRPLEALSVEGAALVIDALFGAGLARPLEGAAAALVSRLSTAAVPVLAVDVPSGIDGRTGAVLGGRAVRAARTVTFHCLKPGHLLFPGRELCGPTHVADIGIPFSTVARLRELGMAQRTWVNRPALWPAAVAPPDAGGHKYDRGHAVVVSGPPECTGAARLAARAALRAGAGLVSLASTRAAFPINAAHVTAVMLQPYEGPDGLARLFTDPRRNAALIGPGLSGFQSAGASTGARHLVEAVLRHGPAAVLDADALTAFADEPELLFTAIRARPERAVVLTPHGGEFVRLFGAMQTRSKLEAARQAARIAGAIMILKGADTVIAAPDGRAAINANAPPWLATAGTGDVLAGFVSGLLAARRPAFEAACAGVWLHGACGIRAGRGLIAEDLPEALPAVLEALEPHPAAT